MHPLPRQFNGENESQFLAFQKVVVGDTRAAVMGLNDGRHLHALEKVHEMERIERVAAVLGPRLSAALPAIRNGAQRITHEIKREISRIRKGERNYLP